MIQPFLDYVKSFKLLFFPFNKEGFVTIHWMLYYLFFTAHMQFGVIIQMTIRNVTDSLENPENSLGKESKKVIF